MSERELKDLASEFGLDLKKEEGMMLQEEETEYYSATSHTSLPQNPVLA